MKCCRRPKPGQKVRANEKFMNHYISGRSVSNYNYAMNLKLRQVPPGRINDELRRSPRERHTQDQFVPIAVSLSLQTAGRWKSPAPRPGPKSTGGTRSYSTLQLNRSNVKRKPTARGRTR
jgi:hypothetical protein